MRDLSPDFKYNLQATTCQHEPICLLELTNRQLQDPILLAQSDVDVFSQGRTYMACGFELSLPSERSGELPRASIKIGNIGQAFSKWVDQSFGGRHTYVRLLIVQKESPSVIEMEWCAELTNVTMTMEYVEGEVTFDDMLNRPAIPIVYDRNKARGLF